MEEVKSKELDKLTDEELDALLDDIEDQNDKEKEKRKEERKKRKQLSKDERKKEFDKIFRFEVMSKNSIVTDYSVSFEMPDGDIGSMYAIQAMTGTPAKMDPITSIIESHSALQTIWNKYNDDLPTYLYINHYNCDNEYSS